MSKHTAPLLETHLHLLVAYTQSLGSSPAVQDLCSSLPPPSSTHHPQQKPSKAHSALLGMAASLSWTSGPGSTVSCYSSACFLTALCAPALFSLGPPSIDSFLLLSLSQSAWHKVVLSNCVMNECINKSTNNQARNLPRSLTALEEKV